jgi:hypothetical protein
MPIKSSIFTKFKKQKLSFFTKKSYYLSNFIRDRLVINGLLCNGHISTFAKLFSENETLRRGQNHETSAQLGVLPRTTLTIRIYEDFEQRRTSL